MVQSTKGYKSKIILGDDCIEGNNVWLNVLREITSMRLNCGKGHVTKKYVAKFWGD